MSTQVVQSTGEVAGDAGADMGAYLTKLMNRDALGDQRQLMTAYDAACRSLIGENDIRKANGKEYKTKSAWRKLARYFGISTQFVSGSGAWSGDHYVARAVVRAVAPWGQYADGVGVASTREGGKQKPEHDCLATAATRAANRAISDLVAMGEVSAEEVEGGEAQEREPRPARREVPRRVAEKLPVDEHAIRTPAKDPYSLEQSTAEMMLEIAKLLEHPANKDVKARVMERIEAGKYNNANAAKTCIAALERGITDYEQGASA